MTKIGRKGKKIIIIASVCIVVLTGAILGGVFGIKAKQEKDWQALQGHDTSLIWVNINNMIAEPVNIEGDLYDYEHYVVEVPNTTQLCVQSYKVGKDATANFYHDENCESKIEDIKAIDCSDDSYAKTFYMKIVSQKGDERKIKLDITVDNFLVPGTIRKANPDGHIEIPEGIANITKDGITYDVIRQENLADINDDKRSSNGIILSGDIELKEFCIVQGTVLDGNNYKISYIGKQDDLPLTRNMITIRVFGQKDRIYSVKNCIVEDTSNNYGSFFWKIAMLVLWRTLQQ